MAGSYFSANSRQERRAVVGTINSAFEGAGDRQAQAAVVTRSRGNSRQTWGL